jgi:hypothetical protein
MAESRVKRPIQSRAAHRLLISLLRREGLNGASLSLVHSPDGRPLLYRDHEQSSIAVTLSHSRAIAACAFSDLGAIGVDVEFRTNRSFQAIAAIAFGPNEREVVAREGRNAFYRIWTLREALVKASISGIPRLADGCDYFSEAPRMGTWRGVIDNQEWIFRTGVLPNDYAIAVVMAPRSPNRRTPRRSLG